MGVPPSNFVVVSFLLRSVSYFNNSNATDFNGGNCSVVVLDIRLTASSRISMQNRFMHDRWIRFEKYYADVSLSKRDYWRPWS